MRAIVTGGAGFIGSHLCQHLIDRGHQVVAVDSFDPFYDPAIKRRNVEPLTSHERFRLVEADIRDLEVVEAGVRAAGGEGADVVVHLAARGGVRPSIQEPVLYSQVNVDGTVATLEMANRLGVGRFVFGSSSSVYGNRGDAPLAEDDPADRPISPYAATKRAGELLCHAYSHIHGISVVCLRLFTVYGPRQRPDLAIHRFARLMVAGEPIPVFGSGSTARDYTYVDDIVQGVVAAIAYTGEHPGAFRIVNVGGGGTVALFRLVKLLGEALSVAPELKLLPAQPGDVERTLADLSRARDLLGYAPRVSIEEGLQRFAEWFRAQRLR